MTVNNKIVVIVGPTACGKTSLSLKLARKFNGEIVSGDSMQIYRGMDIGTAKVSKEEQKTIRHHLIDIRNVNEDFSLADFLKLADEACSDILSRGKMPFIVGGTGLYISSFVDNVSLTEEKPDIEYRNYLNDLAEKEGGAFVREMLKDIDPESYAKLDAGNVKRIIRALEVYKATGKTIGENNRASKLPPKYDFVQLGLTFSDREKLYERINARVDDMFDSGLEEEIKRIGIENCSKTAIQAIGYKQFENYLMGSITKSELTEQIKTDSRHYAKRQLTWFKRDKRIIWQEVDTLGEEQILRNCENIVSNFANI